MQILFETSLFPLFYTLYYLYQHFNLGKGGGACQLIPIRG